MENIKHIFIPVHSAGLFDRAEEAAKRSQGLVCAIMCAAALEAFINDLIEWYEFSYSHNEECPNKKKDTGSFFKINQIFCFSFQHFLTPLEASIYLAIHELEKNRESIQSKYNKIREVLTQEEWGKSIKTYQDFSKLITIRNSIVHIKDEILIMELGTENSKKVQGYPKFLNDFVQQKIITVPNHFRSWIELIETKEFSIWCLNATVKMLSETLDMLPKSDITAMFQREVDGCFVVRIT